MSPSVVGVFVLLAGPMMEGLHAVGERAGVAPATQTGLQGNAERERHRRVRGALQLFYYVQTVQSPIKASVADVQKRFGSSCVSS